MIVGLLRYVIVVVLTCGDDLIDRGRCPLLNSEKKVNTRSPSCSTTLRWDRMRVSETDTDRDNAIHSEFDLMLLIGLCIYL